jgi:hypothetical protein
MDERQRIIVTDFDMSFWRKAGFKIKRGVAAIPAALILIIAWSILVGIFGMIVLR